MEIYCTAHKENDYLKQFYPNIKIVGCGIENTPANWLNAKLGDSINNNHYCYGDLVGQYWVWKNIIINELQKNKLIGFCQYRRYWLNSELNNKKNYYFSDLKEIILLKAPPGFEKYESFIASPFYFKRKFKDYLCDFNIFKLKISLKEQFIKTLGPNGFEIILSMLDNLNKKTKKEFLSYIENKNYLSPHNMYISTPKILDNFFNIIFPWYKSCESIVSKISNKMLIEQPRFFSWFNERFADFWFSSYTRSLSWPVGMFLENNNEIIQIGKIKKHINV
jgi:hypothetical protein